MTEESRKILEALANGIHPFKGYPLYDNHFLNHPHVKQALSEALGLNNITYSSQNFTNKIISGIKKLRQPVTRKAPIDCYDQSFYPQCSIGHFKEDEQEVLYEYGAWLDGLISGKVKASSEEEMKFLAAAKQLDMNTDLEFKYKVYIKYLNRLKIVSSPDYEESMRVETKIDDDSWISRKDLKNRSKWI